MKIARKGLIKADFEIFLHLPQYKLLRAIRDGPFDIQGGRAGTSYFFSLFTQQVICFKRKVQQVFYFFEKITH